MPPYAQPPGPAGFTAAQPSCLTGFPAKAGPARAARPSRRDIRPSQELLPASGPIRPGEERLHIGLCPRQLGWPLAQPVRVGLGVVQAELIPAVLMILPRYVLNNPVALNRFAPEFTGIFPFVVMFIVAAVTTQRERARPPDQDGAASGAG